MLIDLFFIIFALSVSLFLIIFVFLYSRAMLAYIHQNKSGRIKNVALIYYPLALSTVISFALFFSVSFISIVYDSEPLFFIVDILSLPLLVFVLCMGLTGLIFARDMVIFVRLKSKMNVFRMNLRGPLDYASSKNDKLLSFSFRIISLLSIFIVSMVLAGLKNNYSLVSIPILVAILLFSYIVLLETEQKKIV